MINTSNYRKKILNENVVGLICRVIISFNLQGEAAAGPEAAGRHLLGGHEPRGHLHPRRQVAHLRLDRQGLQPHGEAASLQGMSRNLIL